MDESLWRDVWMTGRRLNVGNKMNFIEYVSPLGFDGRRRVRHRRSKSKVTEFRVQYEIFVKGKWPQLNTLCCY